MLIKRIVQTRREQSKQVVTIAKFYKLQKLNKYKLHKEIKKLLKKNINIKKGMVIKKLSRRYSCHISMLYQDPKFYCSSIGHNMGNLQLLTRVDKYGRLITISMSYKKHPWNIYRYDTYEKELKKKKMKKIPFIMKYRDMYSHMY